MTQVAQAAPAEAADCTSEIAALNDAARAGTLSTSRTVITRTLCDLIAGPSEDPAVRQTRLFEGQCALRRLINETPIDPGNDPYGERDFGVVQFLGRKLFWKVDAYENDGTFSWGASNPADAATSYRIVTIMLATDY
ncbi:DUF3768 domain-containing protein [Sphingobium sp. DEHP117]|uniref:DUF3768 domain-containing protein n=1 Tax=Sphingobium sp. DEHP117 TaxID=2993436 RepID=UPI0027D66F0C|nr:DUF3768 domain-containing protein [Sphingobium sp. DEHP117]MDQ4422136.1 DUF3768 domain-containing protein [Sphingobium sp. DEHP117]